MRSAYDGMEVPVEHVVQGCDGALVDDRMRKYHEAMQRGMAPYRWLLTADDETRRRLVEDRQRQQREDEVISVMLRRAEGVEQRGEAERLVEEHHLDQQLPAMRSLAQSRGVEVEVVLRAMLRGELRSIVEMPPADTPTS